jgi:glycosyltransferase involved in cell wall biosynthesis
MQDIEVIVVNDYSPDVRDRMIMEEYAFAYPNKIRCVYHNSNKGLGAARNTGIANAEGEYLLFVDSDDYISLDACEKMYATATANSADLVCADYLYLRGGAVGKRSVNDGIDIVDKCERLYKFNKITAWINLVKKSIITENSLYFTEHFGEDAITILWYTVANKIAKDNGAYLHYVYRNSSLVGDVTVTGIVDYIDSFAEVLTCQCYQSLDSVEKPMVDFAVARQLFGYWLPKIVQCPADVISEIMCKIKALQLQLQDISPAGVVWEYRRAYEILGYEGNDFGSFYSELDVRITKDKFEALAQMLKNKRIVFWAAGFYRNIHAKCLKQSGFEFELTDIVPGTDMQSWQTLKADTDIVLVSGSAFYNSVIEMIGDIEVIDLQGYLNK